MVIEITGSKYAVFDSKKEKALRPLAISIAKEMAEVGLQAIEITYTEKDDEGTDARQADKAGNIRGVSLTPPKDA